MLNNKDNLIENIKYASLHPIDQNPILAKCKAIGVAGYSDIAVLEIENVDNFNLSYLEWSSLTPKTGDNCYVLGDPLGSDTASIAQGTIRDSKYIIGNIVESMCISVPIKSGNSGSPILNTNGEIIGIVSYSHGASESFGWGASFTVIEPVTNYIIDQYHETNVVSNFVGGIIEKNMTAVDAIYITENNISNYPLTGFFFNTFQNGWTPSYIVNEIDDKVIGIYDGMENPSNIYVNYQNTYKLKLTNINDASFTQTLFVNPRQLTSSEDVPLGGGGYNPNNIKLLVPIKKNKNKIKQKKYKNFSHVINTLFYF